MKEECLLIVFAKAPVPGQVKTRLARMIGDEAAARLAVRMLDDTLIRARTSGVGPVELCCAPDATHPEFRRAAELYDVSLSVQGDGDLGARMHRALCRGLHSYRRALLIGTDAPKLNPTLLRTAAQLLDMNPAVIVPAIDGGYVLIGLSQPQPDLFEDITWSTGSVMAQTRERLRRLGLPCAELPALPDIDEAEDLNHLPKEWLE
jgi:rSAM/selenodomain-associated transferase 1